MVALLRQVPVPLVQATPFNGNSLQYVKQKEIRGNSYCVLA